MIRNAYVATRLVCYNVDRTNAKNRMTKTGEEKGEGLRRQIQTADLLFPVH